MILGGVFASPGEAFPPLTVTDVYFAHERGFYMGLYAATLVSSNFFAPIICGYINDGLGMKWVFYIPSIFLAFSFTFLFFFMEETNYDRKSIGVVELSAQQPDGPPSEANELKASTVSSVPTDTDSGTAFPPTKTYLQKLKLWDPPRRNLILHRMILELRFLTWPVVLYSGFAYGSSVSTWTSAVSLPLLVRHVCPTNKRVVGPLVQCSQRDGISYPLCTTLQLLERLSWSNIHCQYHRCCPWLCFLWPSIRLARSQALPPQRRDHGTRVSSLDVSNSRNHYPIRLDLVGGGRCESHTLVRVDICDGVIRFRQYLWLFAQCDIYGRLVPGCDGGRDGVSDIRTEHNGVCNQLW